MVILLKCLCLKVKCLGLMTLQLLILCVFVAPGDIKSREQNYVKIGGKNCNLYLFLQIKFERNHFFWRMCVGTGLGWGWGGSLSWTQVGVGAKEKRLGTTVIEHEYVRTTSFLLLCSAFFVIFLVLVNCT